MQEAENKTKISCPECEAEYMVLHDMDSHYYSIEYCSFCGDVVNDEDKDVQGEIYP